MPTSYEATPAEAIDPHVDLGFSLLEIALDVTRPLGVSRAAAIVMIDLGRRDLIKFGDLLDHLARARGEVAK